MEITRSTSCGSIKQLIKTSFKRWAAKSANECLEANSYVLSNITLRLFLEIYYGNIRNLVMCNNLSFNPNLLLCFLISAMGKQLLF